MYPHILDNILAQADYPALLCLRQLNRSLLERVDARLAHQLTIRAPASKATPGLYIYSALGPHPALAFYPYIADRPFSSTIEADEAEWARKDAYEYGEDHWAWNYAEADWERGWGPWAACTRPSIPSFMDTSRPAPAPPPPSRPHELIPRHAFHRPMRAGEIARAHVNAGRVCAAVRSLTVIGPACREGSRLFQLLRPRSLRIERNARGAMMAKIPVPAPRVHCSLSLESATRQAMTETIGGMRLVEGAPRLIEGVRTLTVEVITGGRCLLVPFARPHSLREVVYVLHPPSAPQSVPRREGFGFLNDVLDQGVVHADQTGITIVGLDAATGPALNLDGDDEGVRDQFRRRMEEILCCRAAFSRVTRRPWAEGRVEALLAAVRLLSREEWEKSMERE
jgi:hypothetical protein